MSAVLPYCGLYLDIHAFLVHHHSDSSKNRLAFEIGGAKHERDVSLLKATLSVPLHDTIEEVIAVWH